MIIEKEKIMEPKYPEIEVKLSEGDGNALAIVATVTKAMKKSGATDEERGAFTKEALSGSYDHLLQTCMKWVNVS